MLTLYDACSASMAFPWLEPDAERPPVMPLMPPELRP